MQIPRPSDADRERFARLVPDEPEVETTPMFGNVGAFLHGRMFMGLFGSDIGVKLPDGPRARLAAQPGTGPFGPADRPIGGSVTLPGSWTPAQAAPWIREAPDAAATLPPKQAKKPAKKTKA
jgi:hypothetical protein